jgi:hypothetical protein
MKEKRTIPSKIYFTDADGSSFNHIEGFSTLIAIDIGLWNTTFLYSLKTDDIKLHNQFNLLNSGGKNMSVTEIVLSKIYAPDFKLKEQIEKLLKETADYKLHDKVILDTLTFCLKKNMSGTSMIQLDIDEVRGNWLSFSKALKATTDYLTTIGFYEFSTLPYKHNFIIICKLFFEWICI